MSDANPNVTGGPPATTEAAKPAPAKPAAPAKPSAPAKAPAKKGGDDRRFFLSALVGSWFAAAWTAMVGSLTLMFLGTLRFLFPNVLMEPSSKVKVGLPESFEEGKVTDKFKDRNIWVVRYEGKIYALSTTCTHLGCTPNWLEADHKFKCPCHGSGFYITGVNFEGPAPRPLERWAVSEEDGQVVVDKSKKFQQELGQWDNTESYIKL